MSSIYTPDDEEVFEDDEEELQEEYLRNNSNIQIEEELFPSEGAGMRKDANSQQIESYSPRKARSDIWNYFKIDGDYASCIYCEVKYKTGVKKQNGTSNLWKHLQSHPGTIPSTATQSNRKRKLINIPPPSKENLKNSLIDYIVSTNQPFNCVEQPSFQQLVLILSQGKVNFPRSGNTVKSYVAEYYESEKQKIVMELAELSSRISFTMDGWTSPNNISFVCVTCHYVDENWNRRNLLLALREIESCSGRNLSKLYKKVLKEFGIDKSKILAITLDNASSNSSMIEDFNQSIEEENFRAKRVRCFAHILNLVCKESLKEAQKNLVTDSPKLRENTLGKLRIIIKYIRDSPQRSSFFRSLLVEDDKQTKCLILDNATRWNSTFEMLERALELKEYIQKFTLFKDYKEDLKDYYINIKSWKYLDHLKNFLVIFKLCTDKISGENYTTISSIIPLYSFLFSELKTFSNNISNQLIGFNQQVSASRSKLKEYFSKSCNCISIGSILDPRYNITLFDTIEELANDRNKIKDNFILEAKNYNESIIRTTTQMSQSTETIQDRFEKVIKARRIDNESELLEEEISRYFRVICHETMDPLDWWRVRFNLRKIFYLNFNNYL
jgi:hypothetical protein